MQTHNKGRRFPPNPLSVEDIVKLLQCCVPRVAGRYGELSALRLRTLIVVLWRTGIRISEALNLEERDLIVADSAVVIRNGKGGKRRIVAMDQWAWQQLNQWLDIRRQLPVGTIFCVLRCKTIGSPWKDSDVRRQFKELAKEAGVRRANPHAFRHTHAVELWREGIDVYTMQQQLGHARLDVTATYLRSLAPVDLLHTIAERKAPTMGISSWISSGS